MLAAARKTRSHHINAAIKKTAPQHWEIKVRVSIRCGEDIPLPELVSQCWMNFSQSRDTASWWASSRSMCCYCGFWALAVSKTNAWLNIYKERIVKVAHFWFKRASLTFSAYPLQYRLLSFQVMRSSFFFFTSRTIPGLELCRGGASPCRKSGELQKNRFLIFSVKLHFPVKDQ